MSKTGDFFGGGGSYAPEINSLQAQAVTQSNANIFINGDFSVDQRGIASTTTSGVFIVDRVEQLVDAGAGVASGGFTKGQEPVGAEFHNVITQSIQISGGNGTELAGFGQRVEDLSRFSGKTLTISFNAKGSVAGNIILGGYFQHDSGSTDVVESLADINLTTDWARYSVTFDVADLTAGIFGADSCMNLWFLKQSGPTSLWPGANLGGDLSVSNVKLEWGDQATAFIPDDPQVNLAKCQRYYECDTESATSTYAYIISSNASYRALDVRFKVTKRVAPTVTTVRSNWSLGAVLQESIIGFHVAGVTDNTASATGLNDWTADAEL